MESDDVIFSFLVYNIFIVKPFLSFPHFFVAVMEIFTVFALIFLKSLRRFPVKYKKNCVKKYTILWLKNSYFRYKCEKLILSSCGRLRPSEARVKRPHKDKITFSPVYRTLFFHTPRKRTSRMECEIRILFLVSNFITTCTLFHFLRVSKNYRATFKCKILLRHQMTIQHCKVNKYSLEPESLTHHLSPPR